LIKQQVRRSEDGKLIGCPFSSRLGSLQTDDGHHQQSNQDRADKNEKQDPARSRSDWSQIRHGALTLQGIVRVYGSHFFLLLNTDIAMNVPMISAATTIAMIKTGLAEAPLVPPTA
jgi:hypothetical protein